MKPKRNGAEYLLSKLQHKDPTAQKSLIAPWTTISGLLRLNDHFPQYRYQLSAKYLEEAEVENKRKTTTEKKSPLYLRCAIWARQVTDFLCNLRVDIGLLGTIEFENWDRELLSDALKLVEFLLDFLGGLQTLKDVLKSRGDEKIPIPFPCYLGRQRKDIKTYEQVGSYLENWVKSVRAAYDELLKSLAGDQKLQTLKDLAVIKEGDWISAATIRELFLRNEVQRKLEDILQHVDGHGGLTSEMMGEVYRNFIPKASQHLIVERDDICAWVPRTLVVVVDTKARLVFTGATQPVCESFKFLETVGRTLTRGRVGEIFAHKIESRSRIFNERAHKLQKLDINRDLVSVPEQRVLTDPAPRRDPEPREKQEKSIEKLYDQCVSGDVELQEASSNTPHVFCWALRGFTLEPEPPCLRCQFLYSRWILFEKPGHANKKAESVRDIFKHPQVKTFDAAKLYPFSFCAETVAAAKIDALEMGTLALV